MMHSLVILPLGLLLRATQSVLADKVEGADVDVSNISADAGGLWRGIRVYQELLPEKNTWHIERKGGGKMVCSGGPYAAWYFFAKSDCKLPPGSYVANCCDKRLMSGWSGGYLEIAGTGKKLCTKYTFNAKQTCYKEEFSVAPKKCSLHKCKTIARERPRRNGRLIGGLSALSESWCPDSYISLEWDRKYIHFQADYNLFGAKRTGKNTGNKKDNKLIKLKNFDTNDGKLKYWVSRGGGAQFCLSNAKAWDTAWAIIPQNNKYFGIGCNSGGWKGRGAYYGERRGPGWVGVKDNGHGKAGRSLNRGMTMKICPGKKAKRDKKGPKAKKCYKFTLNLKKVLRQAGYDKKKLRGLSKDGLRNTCISYNFNHRAASVESLQGMNNAQNLQAAAAIITLKEWGYSTKKLKGFTEDDQRNTIITVANKCTKKSVKKLQGMKTWKIVKLINKKTKCCP